MKSAAMAAAAGTEGQSEMRNLTRAVAGSLLALPIVFAAVGVASADTYEDGTLTVGPNGATISSVQSGTHGHDAFYLAQNAMAGPTGASSSTTLAGVRNGQAYFWQQDKKVSADGVTAHHTGASTGDGDSNRRHNTSGHRSHGLLGGLIG